MERVRKNRKPRSKSPAGRTPRSKSPRRQRGVDRDAEPPALPSRAAAPLPFSSIFVPSLKKGLSKVTRRNGKTYRTKQSKSPSKNSKSPRRKLSPTKRSKASKSPSKARTKISKSPSKRSKSPKKQLTRKSPSKTKLSSPSKNSKRSKSPGGRRRGKSSDSGESGITVSWKVVARNVDQSTPIGDSNRKVGSPPPGPPKQRGLPPPVKAKALLAPRAAVAPPPPRKAKALMSARAAAGPPPPKPRAMPPPAMPPPAMPPPPPKP